MKALQCIYSAYRGHSVTEQVVVFNSSSVIYFLIALRFKIAMNTIITVQDDSFPFLVVHSLIYIRISTVHKYVSILPLSLILHSPIDPFYFAHSLVFCSRSSSSMSTRAKLTFTLLLFRVLIVRLRNRMNT